MSTPTTAVAPLPHYHTQHYPRAHPHPHPPHPQPSYDPYSAHHHSQPQQQPGASAAGAGYRSAAPNHSHSLLNPSTSTTSTLKNSSPSASSIGRVSSYHQNHQQGHIHHQPQQQPAHAGYGSSADGVNHLSGAAPPRPPPHSHLPYNYPQERTNSTSTNRHHDSNIDQRSSHGSGGGNYTHHQPQPLSAMADIPQPPRKRRRSGGPDWNTFYANGLPQEIIVIDDTPEPEANTSRKVVNGNSLAASTNAAHAANGHITVASTNGSGREPATKRRRRTDEGNPTTQNHGYHVQYVGSQGNTPGHVGTPNSTERTNSSLHTTAPTSLSSNGHVDDSQLPLKRKRTTRQQVANEAKRRDVDRLGNRLLAYKPPPKPPKKAADVHCRVVNDLPGEKKLKVDDDDGHYIVVPDTCLTDRYRINRLLGQGTFGKVVEAYDRRRSTKVAVKIIRSVQKYRDASKIELRVLATLKANDEENRNRCIHLRDCFDYRGHICIVTDLLGQSVFDFLKGNAFVPFPNSQIQSFARQLFTSVAFLHDLNLIHTDLKPENILLCSNSYQTFTYNRRIPSSTATTNRQATQRRVLLDTEIRLIDFGSATFQDEYHSSVVSTRHYRAPEIILGLGWSFPCDIWSIGCILVEFFTGDALFHTHDNLEHLAMMEAVINRRVDTHLVQAVNKITSRSNANTPAKYFKRLKLDYPQPDTSKGSRKYVKAMKALEDIITIPHGTVNAKFMELFLDLLRKIFVYDPAERITAKQALDHEWFRELANTDDGTEAAKIRRERLVKDSANGNGSQHY